VARSCRGGDIGPQLRRVVKAAALAVQAGNAPPRGGDEIRTLVLQVWGLTHGLVGLYRAGALKARSDRNAVQFIVDAARVPAPAALEPSHHVWTPDYGAASAARRQRAGADRAPLSTPSAPANQRSLLRFWAIATKSPTSTERATMAHNYAINDDVHHQLQGPQGRAVVKQRSVYTIVTCLPIEADGRPRYRIKSKTENVERVVTEEQISRLG
jgi:hypothetical protein